MDYSSAKEEFINAWGALGTSWGINRTMAQIFALLLISTEELSVEEIMEELSISRGNTSMNLRMLMDWGLVQKTAKKGERKEFFHTDRDVWALARKVAEVRKNREVQPILQVLKNVRKVETNNNPEAKEFKRVLGELSEIVSLTDDALSMFIAAEKSWATKNILRFIKKAKDDAE